MNNTCAHKLLRAVRLDESDLEVYESPAQPGEWAVPGGFEFLDVPQTELTGKRNQAFRSGFLGLSSFGRTTLCAVTEVSEDDYQAAVTQLAEHLLRHYGAPDRAAAIQAAEEEIHYAESLCEYEANTIIALERELTDGGVSERFKRFVPTGADWEQSKPLIYVEDT